MVRYVLLTVVVLLMLATNSQGQVPDMDSRMNLRGQVLDKSTEQPIAGAMVTVAFSEPDTTGLAISWSAYLQSLNSFPGQHLENENLVTFSDSEGHFTFIDLPPGQVDLSFPNLGYATLTVGTVVLPNAIVEDVFLLEPMAVNEFEMVVVAQGAEKEVSRQSMSVLEVEKIPGFGGDVIKSLQALPGVARPTMNDPGAVVVRGSGNYDTRFLLDGVDIPLLFHFGGVKSTYNSFSLGGVDLYPGGFGTRYGGCVGGVVELSGRPARNDRWHTILDASLLDVSFQTEGPLGDDFGLTIGARRSFVGELADAALKDNDSVSMAVAPFYWDAIARLDWGRGLDHELFLTFFAASDHMKMIVSDTEGGSPDVDAATDEVAMDLTFSRFILGYDAYIGARIHNELRLAAGRDNNSSHFMGFFRFEGQGPTYNLRDDLAVKWRPDLTSHLGADFVYSPYDYEVEVNGYPESKLEDKEYSDLGFYANLEWRPLLDLVLVPGIRYDYYHHLDEGKVSFRSSARWDYNENRTVSASAGTFNQSPRPMGHSTDPVYGNPDLPPTTASHLTLGHEWRLGDRLSLKIEGYHNTQDLVPAYADTADLNFLPDAEARMYGLEFMLRHESGDGFFGWLAYSLGRSERRFARDPGNEGQWDPSGWSLHDMDQTHHLEAVGSWELGNNWSFGSRVQFVSGVPVTPVLGFTGNQYEFNGDTGEYEIVEGAYNSDRIDPYFRTDLRVEKQFIKRKSTWSIYLDLQNANYFIYNSPEGYTYNYDFSKRESYGWIFIPAFGARVEF